GSRSGWSKAARDGSPLRDATLPRTRHSPRCDRSRRASPRGAALSRASPTTAPGEGTSLPVGSPRRGPAAPRAAARCRRRFRSWSDALAVEAAPKVGEAAVDEILGPLLGPAQERRRLRHSVSLEVEGHGQAARLHQADETVLDGKADLPRGVDLLGA